MADEIGNHTNMWEDCFSCAATAAASSYKQGETQKAVQTAGKTVKSEIEANAPTDTGKYAKLLNHVE